MPVRNFNVDGEKVIVYAEKGRGDGGLVVTIMVEEADGEYTSFRHWFSDPVAARQTLQSATMADLRNAIAKARSFQMAED